MMGLRGVYGEPARTYCKGLLLLAHVVCALWDCAGSTHMCVDNLPRACMQTRLCVARMQGPPPAACSGVQLQCQRLTCHNGCCACADCINVCPV